MIWLTHLLFALLLINLYAIKTKLSLPILLFSGVITLVSCLLPDIDTPKSKIGKKIFISRIIKKVFGHRGLFHSLFILFLVLAIYLYFSHYHSIKNIFLKYFFVGFIIGYGSHILLDCITKEGIMLFYPLSNARIKGPVKVGGKLEFLIIVILILLNIFIFFKFFNLT